MSTEETVQPKKPSNSYNIFILVLTVMSLVIMVAQILPLPQATLDLLKTYDNVICFIFLYDFFSSLYAAPKKSDYFLRGGGWLDLLGSIPSFGLTTYGGLLRLFRLSRLARITRLMRGENKKQLVNDVLTHRSQYAGFITILLVFIVLVTSSVLVLTYESKSPDANITTGGDALWYSMVTITTVGYGDFYPVTTGGRWAATFIMFSGVGIIGALSSILASMLVGGGEPEPEETPGVTLPLTTGQELAAIKEELAQLRQMLQSKDTKK
jgi:voltage-gated potassium channel